jgi:Ca2+-binding EF-hand superfamily protein
VVLQLHENMLAKSLNREIQEITEDQIKCAVKLADLNHSGNLTRDELAVWIKSHTKQDPKIKEETELMIKKI